MQDKQQLQSQLNDSQEELKKIKKSTKITEAENLHTENADNWVCIKERANKYEDAIKERDSFKDQLCKLCGVENLLKKLKSRADDADQMEDEIDKLKRDLQRLSTGASGDKIRIAKNSDAACAQCERYKTELEASKSLQQLEEKKFAEIEAERNFLRERARTIELMEAELILYKVGFFLIFLIF